MGDDKTDEPGANEGTGGEEPDKPGAEKRTRKTSRGKTGGWGGQGGGRDKVANSEVDGKTDNPGAEKGNSDKFAGEGGAGGKPRAYTDRTEKQKTSTGATRRWKRLRGNKRGAVRRHLSLGGSKVGARAAKISSLVRVVARTNWTHLAPRNIGGVDPRRRRYHRRAR